LGHPGARLLERTAKSFAVVAGIGVAAFGEQLGALGQAGADLLGVAFDEREEGVDGGKRLGLDLLELVAASHAEQREDEEEGAAARSGRDHGHSDSGVMKTRSTRSFWSPWAPFGSTSGRSAPASS